MVLVMYQGIKLLHVSITEDEACHSEDTFSLQHAQQGQLPGGHDIL